MKGTQCYKKMLDTILSGTQRYYILAHLAKDCKLNPHIVNKIVSSLAKENLVNYYFSKKIMIIDVGPLFDADITMLLSKDIYTGREKELVKEDILISK